MLVFMLLSSLSPDSFSNGFKSITAMLLLQLILANRKTCSISRFESSYGKYELNNFFPEGHNFFILLKV